MNKKVCHITTVHQSFDTRIFHKECKTLVKAGYDVSLVAKHDKNENVDGVKIIALPRTKNRLERMFFLTKKAYKLALEQKADLYHFHDPEFLPLAIKLKKITGAKVIYDAHENVPEDILSKYWIPATLRRPISEIFNIYEKRKAAYFDYIITVGADIKDRLKTFNYNVRIIKNYPILDDFKNVISNPFSKKNFTLIYVGALTKIRGIRELVDVLGFLPKDTQLILLGKFSSSDFEKEIKNLKDFEKVRYFGQVPLKEIPAYLSRADIGLVCFLPVPNNIDSNPNKLFEYMAAGLPVVASDFPLWKKIIEGDGCGICVNPLEPKEIARAVEYLMKNPEKAKKMGESGRKAVMEKYNWENESKKLIYLYKELV